MMTSHDWFKELLQIESAEGTQNAAQCFMALHGKMRNAMLKHYPVARHWVTRPAKPVKVDRSAWEIRKEWKDQQRMARVNGNQKGKRGERELAGVLRDAGHSARRGQQFSGANGDADVICDMPGVHWEVKRVEKLNVVKAWKQAKGDCGSAVPVVAHRTNRAPWLVTLSLDDFLALMQVGDALGD